MNGKSTQVENIKLFYMVQISTINENYPYIVVSSTAHNNRPYKEVAMFEKSITYGQAQAICDLLNNWENKDD